MVTTYTASPETHINSIDDASQNLLDMKKLANGDYVVIWETDDWLYLQHFDGHGDPVGARGFVAEGVGLGNGQVAALVGGGFVVMWTGSFGDWVYFQIFDSAGRFVGTQTSVGIGRLPSVIGHEDGGFSIVRNMAVDGNVFLVSQSFDSEGHEVGGPVQVSTVAGASADAPAMAFYDSGLVVVWSRAGGDGIDVYMQRFDANGIAQGHETRVNTPSAGNQSAASVTALEDGGFVIAYVSEADSVLYTQRYNSTGQAAGAELAIANYMTAVTSVAALPDGGYLVAYMNYDDPFGRAGGIFVMRISAANEPIGQPQLVNFDARGAQSHPHIVVLDDGSYVVSYVDYQLGALQRVYYLDQDINDSAPGGHSLTGGEGADIINGLDGNDVLSGGGVLGIDTIDGGDGDDIIGGRGGDTLRGGEGNDIFHVDVRAFIAVVDGGSGFDVIDQTGMATVSVQAVGVEAFIGGNTSDLFSAAGSDVAMTMSGGAGNDRLNGGEAADSIRGNDGGDVLKGRRGADTLDGGEGDDGLDGGTGNDFLTGGAGNDTYTIDVAGDVINEAIDAGSDLVISAISYSLAGTEIEGLSLSGAGHINATGSGRADRLDGNSGNNVLDGGAGADNLSGGAGNDSYIVDNSGDTVYESSNGGTDMVSASVSFVLSSFVENLTLTSGAINGTGNSQANILTGTDGSNVLDGGAGSDILIGGGGNDHYVVDHPGDAVVEAAGGGNDLVEANLGYVLSDNIERLTLTGLANIAGTGNALNNVMIGNDGSNKLDGGLGSDLLVGGKGNDTFIVDDAGDVVREAANEGIDLVQSSVSFNLGSQYIENLNLLGTANTTATGNSLVNTLVGNSGNNVLNGAGGADRMYGMAGNDTYYVDNIADRTYESADGVTNAGGYEVVYASVRVVLDKFIEDLVIAGSVGLAGTGNDLNNRLTGNAAGNALLGKGGNDVMDGGAGADTLAGGLGDDTFFVDNVLDQAVELSGQGNDVVYSSVTFNAGNQYLETLVLTGTDDILLSGNAIAQTLTGNAGANRISGLEGDDILNGGAGNDGLSGGLGADLFIFSLGSGVDRIDFKANDNDLIDIHAYAGGVVNGGGVTISQSGAHAVIDLGGGNLIVALNTTATDPGLLSHIVW